MGKVNALLRTVALLGLVAIGGFWTQVLREKLLSHEQDLEVRDEKIGELEGQVASQGERIEELGVEIEERDRRILELETALMFLKVDYRLATIDVLDQWTDEGAAEGDGDAEARSLVRFQELDADGSPIGPVREFEIEGRVLYLESLVIKFGDDYVEKGDFLRGSSVSLFRRAFGENQSPAEGVLLEGTGARPHAYTGDDLPDPFYDELWQRFWDYANDPEMAAEKGVRAIHGEAPFMELREGKRYQVELRSSGGLTIVPVEE